ncbi:MAG: NADH-quinone oxidoreductase subunit L [Planctomycetota bacterium]
MEGAPLIPTLLLVAWLAPLAAFVAAAVVPSVELRRRRRVSASTAKAVAQVATGCCLLSLGLAITAMVAWFARDGSTSLAAPLVGRWFGFIEVASLSLAAEYCVDTLTVLMATVVTTVAACVHVYSLGYFDEELAEGGVQDHEATPGETPLVREGRLHRYYQHLSLFLFSMLGLVVAGNLAMTFVFWELVGVSSYLLIGYYYERDAAGTAAGKAMLVNRIADAGLLLGMIALWNATGTLAYYTPDGGGLFDGAGLLRDGSASEYLLLLWAGLGLFCGCIGKSAQAPLWSWLPDAMQGPTPVSALVHSATMVAAGVFLLGRVYPLLLPEVLVVIASVGAVTLLLGAVLALGTTDFKRVLAFSTISQLGYMVLAVGLGGWVAGLMHLVTHAAFKALLFLTAGSVMHATHTGDLAKLGGLRRTMPRTALLAGIGVLAIVGAGLPIVGIGLSGFYSKDLIFEQAIAFGRENSWAGWLSWTPTIGAVLTAFYMGRLWLLAFAGEPRSEGARAAHESPASMLAPMYALGLLAILVAWPLPLVGGSLQAALEQGDLAAHKPTPGAVWQEVTIPDHHAHHAEGIKTQAGLTAFGAMLLGLLLAAAGYRFGGLLHPIGSAAIGGFDRHTMPALNRATAWATRATGGLLAGTVDRLSIDGGLTALTRALYHGGKSLHRIETGGLRHYVVLLVLGVVILGSLAINAASQLGVAE